MLQLNRRQLVQTSAIVGLGARHTRPKLLAQQTRRKSNTGPCSRILFQGDSITVAGRDRKADKPNDTAGLGRGYPILAAGELLRDHPGLKLQVLNRGISGNKVPDLAARWQADCIDLQPTVLSILIGVNDIWHKLNGKYEGTVADYANGYRKLIEDTQSKLPEARIVICEPFVLKCGAVSDKWFPEFDNDGKRLLSWLQNLS